MRSTFIEVIRLGDFSLPVLRLNKFLGIVRQGEIGNGKFSLIHIPSKTIIFQCPAISNCLMFAFFIKSMDLDFDDYKDSPQGKALQETFNQMKIFSSVNQESINTLLRWEKEKSR